MPDGTGRQGWRDSLRRAAPALSLVVFAVALWLLHRELASLHYRQVEAYLAALPPARLALALLLTAGSYLALSSYDLLALRYVGRPLPYRKVAFASFVGYAFSNAIGHPLFTGTPLRARLYSGWGLSALDIGRVVLFSFATFWTGILTVGGFAYLAGAARVPGMPSPAVERSLGIFFLVLVAGYLAVCFAVRRPITLRGFELALPAPRLALTQIGLASLDWALAGAVLYALMPRAGLKLLAFLGIFLLAQTAALASQVPAGLGVFETAMLLLLPRRLPRLEVLGGLVAYRAVYYLLPLLVAAVALAAHEAVARRAQLGRLGRLARTAGARAAGLVPQVLALTTFAGGVVLLASGATPAVHARLTWLGSTLPLPVIELSHFAGSLVGVALLFLARGLQQRLDAAYQLTVALLAAGIAVSLLKGLDWEEALVLSLMLAALLPCRRQFHRRAALISEPFTPGWIAAIAVALGVSLWLGFFSFKHVDYSHDLWWHFTVMGNAPRFLRATVGGLALALALAFQRLLRPAPPEPALPTGEDLAAAAAVAAASPRSSAHLALVGDKQLLFNAARTAFLMYGVERRSWIAMGDPVGPEEERADLAWRFRELADRHGGWTAFYQVSGASLPLYIDLGLSFTKLGEEARVPLAGFDLEGRARKKLRHAHRRAVDEGYRFEVVPVERVPALLPELEAISDQWLEARSTREKGFSLGYFDPAYLARLPVALVRREGGDGQGGGIVAFANLWPGAPGSELSVDLMRHVEGAHGVMDYLFLELMMWGRGQGYAWFDLGMAPFAGLEARALAPLKSRLGALLYRHGEHFYNFQGLRQYKQKFDPIWEPRYLASPGGLALPRLLTDLAALVSRGLRGVVAR